jgi:hypothetical protein
MNTAPSARKMKDTAANHTSRENVMRRHYCSGSISIVMR